METTAADRSQGGRHFSRFLLAGLATSIIDGLFATVQTVLGGAPVSRLWQGVASVVIGPSALTAGTRTAALGILIHCSVAFFWSAVFVFGISRSTRIRRVLASRWGVLKIAAVYGPAIWIVMSLVLIPLLMHRPPTVAPRWLVQLFGHILFVGMPIVGFGSRGLDVSRRQEAAG